MPTSRDGTTDQRRLDTDARAVLIVIVMLGVNATLMTAGLLWLTYLGKEPNAALYGLSGSLIGSLGTMLANTHTAAGSGQQRKDDPQPVNVVNEPENPVPTTDEPAPAEEAKQ